MHEKNGYIYIYIDEINNEHYLHIFIYIIYKKHIYIYIDIQYLFNNANKKSKSINNLTMQEHHKGAAWQKASLWLGSPGRSDQNFDPLKLLFSTQKEDERRWAPVQTRYPYTSMGKPP